MITCLQKNTKGDYPIKVDDVIIDDDVISDDVITHEQKIIKMASSLSHLTNLIIRPLVLTNECN